MSKIKLFQNTMYLPPQNIVKLKEKKCACPNIKSLWQKMLLQKWQSMWEKHKCTQF
jgi:hypothetical protein